MDVADCLAAMRAALSDADAELTMVLGGHREVTRARLWRDQVLVDWEPDERAGGCLLRPELVERLSALHATMDVGADELRIRASGRVLVALSPQHRELVAGLGGEQRVELRVRLRFGAGIYAGGEERYVVVQGGRQGELLRITATVTARPAKPTSPRTSRAPK